MKTVVLGAGRVGSAMAIDLAKDKSFDVRVADRDTNQLARLEQEHGILGERVDFSLPSTVTRAVQDADLVISAVPGFLGFRTLEAIIKAGAVHFGRSKARTSAGGKRPNVAPSTGVTPARELFGFGRSQRKRIKRFAEKRIAEVFR